jgi:mannitol-1-/sugar-/sorbitol-6-/2-deoxyglucose-6-phosphatase
MQWLEAVIYDMDGVLIDSEPFWKEAEIESFARVGVTLTHADCNQTMGMRIDQVVAYWADRRPWDESQGSHRQLVDWIVSGVIERVRANGQTLPGVQESIGLFRDRGVRLALASSSSFEIIRQTIEALGLTNEFEILHSAENELHGKPSPDVYVTTLRMLGVSAEACLAIEDSRNGISSAKAAGLTCIAIPDPLSEDMTLFDHADVMLHTLKEIDEPVLRELGFH